MALEIQGKLIKLLAPVTGEGRNGAWTKQEFVIETFEQYPKKICLSAWTDKINQLQRFQLGDDVKVSFNVESREYNERWYTELRIWKIDSAGSNSASPNQNSYNAPSQNQQSYGRTVSGSSEPVNNFQPVSDSADSFLSSEQDDLPF